MRLSRDGMRVVAVVDGMLYTAAVSRDLRGAVTIGNVRRLRPMDLGEVVAADWRANESVVAITRSPEMLVGQISADGLALQAVVGNNLTPPLTAIAAASNRALLVTDQSGVWSLGVATRRPGARCSAAPSTRCPSTPADRRRPGWAQGPAGVAWTIWIVGERPSAVEPGSPLSRPSTGPTGRPGWRPTISS